MTEDELLDEMRRMGHGHREATPLRREAVWDRIQARRVDGRRRRVGRRIAIGLATAASLALIAAGIRGYRRIEHARADIAMTTASAIVIQRHLAQSDTMIGAFRTAVASGTWDSRLTARARDLELATRRIQGGRIAANSTLAGLLTDLDLVLTEIVGYGDLTAHRDTEARVIEYSIDMRQVIPRLRTASAGAAARTTSNEGLDP